MSETDVLARQPLARSRIASQKLLQQVCNRWGTLLRGHPPQSGEAQSTDLYDRLVQEFRKIFQPYSCDLHRMNATHFSKCLTGQRIIIIGDSTMRQVFQSLACLLSDHVADGYLVVSPLSKAPCSISRGAQPCSATLASSLALHWAWHLIL